MIFCRSFAPFHLLLSTFSNSFFSSEVPIYLILSFENCCVVFQYFVYFLEVLGCLAMFLLDFFWLGFCATRFGFLVGSNILSLLHSACVI